MKPPQLLDTPTPQRCPSPPPLHPLLYFLPSSHPAHQRPERETETCLVASSPPHSSFCTQPLLHLPFTPGFHVPTVPPREGKRVNVRNKMVILLQWQSSLSHCNACWPGFVLFSKHLITIIYHPGCFKKFTIKL